VNIEYFGMFPKEKRISSELFKEVYANGAHIDGQYVYAKVLHTDTSLDSRFGVVVPQSTVAQSAHRSRVKRRITHALKQCVDQLDTGYAMVVFAKEDIRGIANEKIQHDIQNLLEQVVENGKSVH